MVQTETLALAVAKPRLLVFSKTAGFRHDSIPVGIQTMKELGAERGFGVEGSEDATVFSEQGLSKFDVVMFLCTTGDVLNADQERAFEKFIRNGGGYVGVHAAADTEYDWPFYGEVVGAWFKGHPAIQKAKVKVEDRSHATTSFLLTELERTDEWYTYRTNPRANVHVLMSLDESTYQGGGMGDHPITWWHDVGKGRAFYTGFGHTAESYSEPSVRRMLAEAVIWAAQGKKPEDAAAIEWKSLTGWMASREPELYAGNSLLVENVPGANKHLVSTVECGDCLLHVEFRIPKGSNSGVYLMSRYEVQILDSFGVEQKDLKSSDCGGIYERWGANGGFEGKAPLVNAFAGPGRWNTYDILFRAPRFEKGKKTENAKFLEVRLNGVVIQKNVEVTGPTRAPAFEEEAPEGPVLLQGDHGPIAYRNVWIKKLKL